MGMISVKSAKLVRVSSLLSSSVRTLLDPAVMRNVEVSFLLASHRLCLVTYISWASTLNATSVPHAALSELMKRIYIMSPYYLIFQSYFLAFSALAVVEFLGNSAV